MRGSDPQRHAVPKPSLQPITIAVDSMVGSQQDHGPRRKVRRPWTKNWGLLSPIDMTERRKATHPGPRTECPAPPLKAIFWKKAADGKCFWVVKKNYPSTEIMFHAANSLGSAMSQSITPTFSAQVRYCAAISASNLGCLPARFCNSVRSASMS